MLYLLISQYSCIILKLSLSKPFLMASSLALRRLVSSSLLSRSLRPASRLFNTSAAPEYDIDDTDLGFDRRVFYPFSEVFGPAPLQRRRNDIVKRNWYAKESGDGLHLRVDMPGLGKEDVKVSVKHNTLVIQGEVKKDSSEEGRIYSSRIDIPDKLYKINIIKGEMKNGVLKLFVPKIKEEEENRNDVFHVNVE